MSSFTRALVVRHQLDGFFRNEHFFSYELIFGFPDPSVDVNAGALSNLASVPWYLQWLVPKVGKYDQATFVHDLVYARHAVNFGADYIEIDRKYADRIFYQAMLVLDVAPWRAKAMYYAVRLRGRKHWKKSRFVVSPRECVIEELPELAGP